MSSEIEALRARLAKAESERDLAVRREAATESILRLIKSSPEDLTTTLQAIPAAVLQLTGMASAIFLFEEGKAIIRGVAVTEALAANGLVPRDLIGTPSVLNSWPDFEALQLLREPFVYNWADLDDARRKLLPFGARSVAVVPINDGVTPFGLMNIFDTTGEPISQALISVFQAFADRAAIAIENARLIRELRESNRTISENLDTRRVMGEVLSIVASAPTDLDKSMPKIAEAAMTLSQAHVAGMTWVDGDQSFLYVMTADGEVITDGIERLPEGSASIGTIARLEGRVVEFKGSTEEYLQKWPFYSRLIAGLEITAISSIAIPMFGPQGAIGAIAVSRTEATDFPERIKTLLGALATQAVVAVENARLFSELRESNRQTHEALEVQRVLADVLRIVAGAPANIEVALEEIGRAAHALTRSDVHISVLVGDRQFIWNGPEIAGVLPDGMTIGGITIMDKGGNSRRDTISAAVLRENRLISFDGPVAQLEEHYPDTATTFHDLGVDYIALVFMPLADVTGPIGVIGLMRRTPGNYSDAQLRILRTLADQAVVAIQNARLFNELSESNRTITENLDIQRVMGDVLTIVANTPADLDATLPAIASAARKLCDAGYATMHWIDGGTRTMFDGFKVSIAPLESEWVQTSFPSRVALEGKTIEFSGSPEEFADRYPYSGAIVSRQWQGHVFLAAIGQINVLGVPMRGRDGAVGSLAVTRLGGETFSDRDRTVMFGLATQAVVAVENSKLFNQLKSKSEELEVASRHKSEFLANMSHELRTPLNAIIGYAELLQEECEDLGQQDFLPDLGKIHSAGKHLLTLISGILDLSKVEAGRMTMYLEDFDVATLVKDADAIVRPLVEKNRNTFVIECPADIGTMHADLVKVRQVLFNLLSNSAKFTEGGTITLTVGKEPSDDTIRFAIRDTGIGMTEEQLGRLFEAFSQANAETSRKYGGTGLGLALSREFCRMLGGDITVVSEAAVGSTFTVVLPVTCIESESAA